MRPLTRVRRATVNRDRAEQEWRNAIREAVRDGETIRAVGEAAGVSHVHVLRLSRK